MRDDEASARQSELHADADRLRSYGEQHPETWTGISHEGPRLIGLFTDPDEHRDAVLRLMTHPGSVEVRAAPYSRAHLDVVDATARRLVEREPGACTSGGVGLTAARLRLRGGFERVARELHQRFGDAIELSVGAFDDPLDPAQPTRVRSAPTSNVDLAHASFTVAPDSTSAAVGSIIAGLVHITNVSTVERLVLHTDQPLDGLLLHGDDQVGMLSGLESGTGRGVRLDPAESTSIKFYAGTESLDPRLGTILPPGTYPLVIEIPVRAEGKPDDRIVTKAVAIELTAH